MLCYFQLYLRCFTQGKGVKIRLTADNIFPFFAYPNRIETWATLPPSPLPLTLFPSFQNHRYNWGTLGNP